MKISVPPTFKRSTSGLRLVLLLFVAALSGWTPTALAQGADTIRFSGFGTMGLTDASAPHGWGFRRDLGQSGSTDRTRADVDSRLGLQLNYTPTTQLEFVTQLLAGRHSPGATLGDHMEWAFAAIRPTPQLTARLGRVNLDTFLNSDHRNVGFAFLPARPPVELYGLLPTSLNGADVSHWLDLGDARWRFKIFGGRADGGDRGNKAGVPVSPTVGGSISRESGGLLIRLGVTRGVITNAPAPLQPLIEGLASLATLPVPNVASEAQALRQRLDTTDAAALYTALGARYESGPWLLSAELAKVSGHPFVDLISGYASAGRRFGDWTLYSVYSRVRSSTPAAAMPQWAPSLAFSPALAAQVQALGTAAATAVNLGRPSQRTISLGARWDFHPQMSLKLQWDQIGTESNGASLWTESTPDSGRSHVTSVLLDYVF